MSFWEIFATIGTAAGLFAAILGAWLTYAARKNGEATRSLRDQIHRETLAVLDRMDQRADEKQREVIAAMQALGRA
jgi:biopolymer transport protein ExbB/TolQ